MTYREQMETINWTLDQTFPGISGKTVRVLQREVSLEPASVQQELEPFCHLRTLLKVSGTDGPLLRRGMVSNPRFSCNRISFGFQADEQSGTQIRIQLENVETIRATAWRVNEKLDALQLNFDSPRGCLYLQTGGRALLDLAVLNPDVAAAGPSLSPHGIFLANTRAPAQRTE